MAALKDSNAMPNGVDDLTDSTVGPGSASSGWNNMGGYTYVPPATFAFLTGAVLIDECPPALPPVSSDWPSGGQRIPHPSGVR